MFKDVSFQFLHGCNALGIVAASFFVLVAEALEATKSKKDIAESPTEAILQGFKNLVGMSAGNAQKKK